MQARRWLLGAGAIVAALGTGSGADAEGARHKGYEAPAYTVERAIDGMELRRYGPSLVAEVVVEGSRDTAIRSGFRVLAGYIFGGNETEASIAMTVPVAQSAAVAPGAAMAPGGSGAWVVRFMMPAGSTPETLPRPRDGRIRLVAAGSDRQAVRRFSGIATAGNLAAEAEALRALMAAEGLQPVAGPHYYFYDPPMTLPWRRRNEVSFTLR